MGLASELREIVHEQVEYRELLYQMTSRDLLLRYKQTVMGFGWAVFMPLINTAVFSVVFMRVAPIETGRAISVVRLRGSAGLELLRVVASIRGRIADGQHQPGHEDLFSARDFSVLGGPCLPRRSRGRQQSCLIGMMAYYHVAPTAAPVPAGRPRSCTSRSPPAVALLLAMGNLFFRDVKYLFEVVITVWMFATSVVYPGRQASAAGWA